MDADGISRGSRQFVCSCPGFPFLQILGQPFPIQDDQLVEYLIPATVPLGPFLHDIPAGHVKHFLQGLVAGEHALCFCHFPVLAVQRLYNVGGIHNAADII